MRDKYANKHPVSRFFHKYTGFIFIAVFLSIVIPLWMDYTDNQEFFDKWSCAVISEYVLLDHSFGFTPYSELDDQRHEKVNVIFQECHKDGGIIDFVPQAKP